MDERSENQNNGEATTAAAPATGETEALRAQVESQGKRIEELARAYAEILNDRESFRKRLERERERQVESARADVSQAILDALDELRRALGAPGGQGLVEGVRMIADGLQKRAESMGLQPIPATGHFFDPGLHEAIDLVPTTDREADGKVIEEVRAGWKAGERVIRPARVRVARFVPTPDGGETLPS